MKLKFKLSLVFFIVLNIFSTQKILSQCFQIESILVDACGSQEGFNEMVRFKVGSANLNTSNLSANWPANSWKGIAPNALTTAKVATLNAGIQSAGGCGRLIQPTAGVLPANAKVVLVTSYLLDITFNFFGAINEDIYIIFQNNDTSSGGHFGNFGTGTRFLDISFGSSCTDSVEYDRSLLIDKDGNKSAGDGASVNFTPSGIATYANIGCNAPIEVFDVNAGTSPISACQGSMVSLLGTAQGQQSVTWSDGGKGGLFSAVNNLNSSYTISPSATGTITLTLTATSFCSSTKMSTIILNVNTKEVPTFNTIPPVCQDSPAPLLPTSSTNAPPISGTWNSTINTSVLGATNYTFTPNTPQCATTTSLSVTVNPNVVSTFDTVAPICSGALLSPLPLVSKEGINGTWDKALNNTETTTYSFSPNSGQCGTTSTLIIIVNPGITPLFNPISAICIGETLSPLPTTSTNGISGTWDKPINNTETTTYTFTPNSSNTSGTNLVVNGDFSQGNVGFSTDYITNVNPNPGGIQKAYTIGTNPKSWFTPFSACSDKTTGTGNMLIADGSTSNGGNDKVWGQTISNLIPNQEYELTYYLQNIVNGGPARIEVLINNISLGAPAVAPLSPCIWEKHVLKWNSGNNTSAIISIFDRETFGNNDFAIDDISFSPVIAQCVASTSLTIVVNPLVTPTFDVIPPFCSGSTLTSLPLSSKEGISGTWDKALNNTETTTYTFTPTAGQCAKEALLTLTVNPKITTIFDALPSVCQNAPAPILPTASTNNPPINGTWNSVVNTSAVGTTDYTFTPNAGQCATPATISVTIESCGYGVFASAAWLKNCNASGEFYNITGTGADLINPSSPAGSFITNLGSYVQNSGSLTFGGGEIKTFKAPNGNVCGATMFYNVHLQTDSAGTFTSLPLQFFSDCNSGSFNGGGPCKDRDQKWQTVTNDLLDMTALSPGNYILEVYYSVNGDIDSNSQCDDTSLLNNSGLNFLSSFSIQGAPQYASTNPTTCTGTEGTITISGLLANASYELSYKDDTVAVGPISISSNGTGDFLISGLNAGSYTDFIIKADCGSYTNNTPINLVSPTLSSSISKTDNSVCQSETVPCNGSATVIPQGSGSYSYVWDDTLAQTAATATALCPGTYNVFITDLGSLCNVTRTITVGNTAVLPSITSLIKATSPICSGSNASFSVKGTPNATVTYSINSATAQTVVLDNAGDGLVSINSPVSDVTIVLSQISLATCSAVVTNTDTVIVSSPPSAGVLSGNPVICSDKTSLFSSTITGGLWSSSNTSIATIDASSGEISAVSSGQTTITYTVAASGGCTIPATETRVLTVNTSPTVSISSGCVGKNFTLEATGSDTAATFKWFEGDSPLAEISNKLIVKTFGTYTVEINNSGCTANATLEVTSFYCDIPKGISPNGDELNDYFDLSNLNVKKLEIFNRYGVKVYSKTNYKKEWDGKSDGGQELPDATYYYVIEEDGNSPITGWVYINR